MGRPSYQPELRDIVLTLLMLDHTSLGRYKLSEYLNLTKAKTRSVLEHLIELGIVEARRGRGGSTLTSKGRKLVAKIKNLCLLDWNQELVEFDQKLIGKESKTAIIFIEVKDEQTSGLYERDMAVRQGADGAITLRNDDGIWKFPNDDEPAKNITFKDELVKRYSMVSIAFGESLGAVYAASVAIVIYHLHDKLEKILQL